MVASLLFLLAAIGFVSPCSETPDTQLQPKPAVVSTSAVEGARLRFGVLSDVHLRLTENPDILLAAFAAFKRRDVEAVAITGDVVEDGKVVEFERFAEVWRTAFGGRPGKDGAPELVVIWGNHDCRAASKYHGKTFSPEEERTFMMHGDGRERVWRMLFDEPFPGGVYLKRVKGVPFVCVHWGAEDAVGAWLKDHEDAVGVTNLFFVLQHPHPSGTVFGMKTQAKNVTADLANYPNAFVISGHSHTTLADDAALWQGAFTSMAAGTPRGGSPRHGPGAGAFANGAFKPASAKPPYPHMRPCDGGCVSLGAVVTVRDDRVVVERLDFLSGQPVGADWVLPLPLETHPEAPFVFASRAPAPEFAPDAKVSVKIADGTNAMGENERLLQVEVPQARPVGPYSRAIVNTFEVLDAATENVLLKADALQPGQSLPIEKSLGYPACCAFAAADLPSGRSFRVRVTPRNAAGKSGKPLVSEAFGY